jgi:hypothetical protein
MYKTMVEKQTLTKFESESLKGRCHFGDLDVNTNKLTPRSRVLPEKLINIHSASQQIPHLL